MQTEVLEGTLSEVQQQMSELPYAPETRVRVTVVAAEPPLATQRTRNGIRLVPVKESETANAAATFHSTEFRNRVPLLPRRELAEPLTTEFVKRLLDEEDEEWLRDNRTGGC
jgi:hypothetical protein